MAMQILRDNAQRAVENIDRRHIFRMIEGVAGGEKHGRIEPFTGKTNHLHQILLKLRAVNAGKRIINAEM